MNAQTLDSDAPTATFADRIALLIQRVGSATKVARLCGFSEGVVRSWRDGHTDPSRARCVTLARTLGISLVWLVAGEGSMQVDPTLRTVEDQRTTQMSTHRPVLHATVDPVPSGSVDNERLNAAMQLLQSELELSGGGISLADNMALLTELYEIVGPAGAHVDAAAMAAFNQRLAGHIRDARRNA
jgi:DNA-binding transcriptional regulator YdaS (Cro superfamily)